MKIMMKMTMMKSLETWSMVTTPAAAKLSEYLGSGFVPEIPSNVYVFLENICYSSVFVCTCPS